MKEKVYCKDCKYCGGYVPVINPGAPYFLDHPTNTVKNYYMHGVEITQRYCENPDVPHNEEYDTFYKHIKQTFTPVCHEQNKDNDCKYFKARIE